MLAISKEPGETTTSSRFKSPEVTSGSLEPSFFSRCDVKDCLVVIDDTDDCDNSLSS